MSIDLTCARCRTRFHVPESFAGGEARCPNCSALTPVPGKDEILTVVPAAGITASPTPPAPPAEPTPRRRERDDPPAPPRREKSHLPLILETGAKRGMHKLDAISGSHNVRQYAARPTDGRALLLRTEKELLLIEFE